MCFFRRKSKRKAAAAAAAATAPVATTDSSLPAPAASELAPDARSGPSSESEVTVGSAVATSSVAPPAVSADVAVGHGTTASERGVLTEVRPSSAADGSREGEGGITSFDVELLSGGPGGDDPQRHEAAQESADSAPDPREAEDEDAATTEPLKDADVVEAPVRVTGTGGEDGSSAPGTLRDAEQVGAPGSVLAEEGVVSSADMAPPQQPPAPGAPRDAVWGQDGADGKSAAVLSELIDAVTRPSDSDAGGEQDTEGGDAETRSALEHAGADGGRPDGARPGEGSEEPREPIGPQGTGATSGIAGTEEGATDVDELAGGEGSASPRADTVVETTAAETTESDAMPTTATSAPEETPTPDATDEAWPTMAVDPDDPDLMEAPSNRPVPEDAIRRASEALDAAVNAAPAVLGPVATADEMDDDEVVAYVDGEFTHSDTETAAEAEPDGVASDYSVRVTDPIPVQSLSAPGVSRETSGPAPTAHGTQQPTGGPHGSDDERRSALIATVPAVDDTTPVAAELAMDARRRIELQGRKFPRPPKTRIITVANQKGGVGKTTTTVNIAAGLAQSGLNVLVIDNDPQGNASTALGIEHRAGTPSVYEILVEGESLASTVQACPDIPNLWGVPATIDLSGSEIELVSLVSRETRLRKAIDKYLADRVAAGEERIDYVLIDCPPSLGLLTVNAFVAGREVFIPIQCEYYALEGLSQLLKTIDLIRSHLNPELRVSSILLTMYDGRTNLAQQVAGEVRSHFPAETFKTTIPRSVRISEAPSYGQTVMTYDATSTGALAYLQASRELAERGQGGSSPRRAMKAETVGAQD
ncbi:AAA family ATPase [Promicromonospora citrea]|uniref:AAA family ATPase n=1 Tax=Promicromonospora citrea TaxID=43677 RepID=UPI0027E586D6|nr:AAA family ATPase [Promicromonospora citrea]